MPIQRGDVLILSLDGVEHTVVAMTAAFQGFVQVRNASTYCPCPEDKLHEPYVPTDPDGRGLHSGGAIFVQPNGQTTEDRRTAKLFKTLTEAVQFRNNHSGIPTFMPKKLKDC